MTTTHSDKLSHAAPPADPRPCSLCPKLCRFACPVTAATADEGATPTAMMQAWEDARAGRLDWEVAAEAIQRCSGCEACRPPCEYERDVPSLLARARAEAWEHGAVPAAVKQVHEAQLRSGTPFGTDAQETLRAHAPASAFDAKARVLFWPGCRCLGSRPEQPAQVLALLAALGSSHVSLPARRDVPGCCGAFLHAAGDAAGLQVSAVGLEQYFNRQRTLVMADASCLNTVRGAWIDAGVAVTAEVLHVTEYLAFFAERIAELGTAACQRCEAEDRPFPKIVVHDACGLHRRAGRGGAARQLLRAATGQEPGTLGPSPDRAGCCGAGDFLDLRVPADAAATAARLGREPLAPDAWLVTGDAGWLDSLRAAFPDHRVDDTLGFLLAWLGPDLGAEPGAQPGAERGA